MDKFGVPIKLAIGWILTVIVGSASFGYRYLNRTPIKLSFLDQTDKKLSNLRFFGVFLIMKFIWIMKCV